MVEVAEKLRKQVLLLHPLERRMLRILASESSFAAICSAHDMPEVEVLRGCGWLEQKGLCSITEEVQESVVLGKNGREYASKGMPEKRVLLALKDGSASLGDLIGRGIVSKEEMNVSMGALQKKGAVSIAKGEGGVVLSLTDVGREALGVPWAEEEFLKKGDRSTVGLSPEEKEVLSQLLKRKDFVTVETRKIRSAVLTEDGQELLSVVDELQPEDRLTQEMLVSGSWKGKEFRHFNVETPVQKLHRGRRHFVNQAISYMKRIWLDMGFQEMEGNILHTAFWDMDALFIPQDHSARAMQDTFFIANPSHGSLPTDFLPKVKASHENGGDSGSLGWRYTYSEDIAKENLLRPHTTVLSAQTLSRLKKEDLPAKFFTVGKVFRNEALDWKHLFEFHQVEGIVVDPKATFADLKGFLRQFYLKMGFTDVRMRPAYFPYTEPSVEVEVYHPGKEQWVELGGAGVFRPEVVVPLLGFDCPVLAWGQGMERIVVEYFGLNDLRDLYRNDIKQIRDMKEWMR